MLKAIGYNAEQVKFQVFFTITVRTFRLFIKGKSCSVSTNGFSAPKQRPLPEIWDKMAVARAH